MYIHEHRVVNTHGNGSVKNKIYHLMKIKKVSEEIEYSSVAKFRVVFPVGERLLAMVKKTPYTYVDASFLEDKHLPIPPEGVRFANVEAVNFDRPITATLVLDILSEMGERPAGVAHHLAIGCQMYPLNRISHDLQDLLVGTEGFHALISLGNAVRTCVQDLRVYPGFTIGGTFGSGLNLIGYHADTDREYGTEYLFLIVRSESL